MLKRKHYSVYVTKDHSGKKMTNIQEGLLSCSFDTNAFVTAFGGSVGFGKVTLQRGILTYLPNNLILIPTRKLSEFLSGLKVIAKNLTINDPTAENGGSVLEIEISVDDIIVFKENTIIKKDKEERRTCELKFDLIRLFHFFQAVSEVIPFVTNPTAIQFSAIKSFLYVSEVEQKDFETCIKTICHQIPDLHEAEKILLEEYLESHKYVLNFTLEIRKMSHVSHVSVRKS